MITELDPNLEPLMQVKTKELLPTVETVTISEPARLLTPVQAPEAEQEIALVEDQVSVVVFSSRTDEERADSVTVGVGVPPPLHETSKKIETKPNVWVLAQLKCIKEEVLFFFIGHHMLKTLEIKRMIYIHFFSSHTS